MEYRITNNQSISDSLERMNDGDILFLDEGIYQEKVKIINNNIKIIGKGPDKTFIVNKDYSPKIHKDNKEYNTFRTYTVMVTGQNVEIEGISIKNLSTPANKYGQAVALHVLGDMFKISNSGLFGAQDTLFCGPLPINLQTKYIDFLPTDELTSAYSRQLYESCYIEGDVDFIFGAGISIFDNCHIHSIENNIHGYISAPSHNSDQEFGFTFINCKLTSSPSNKNFFLGRPWRDYGKSTFINCTIEGDFISKLGFDPWNNSGRDKTARFEVYNININTSPFPNWVKVLDEDEVKKYTLNNIFKLI